MSLWATVNFQSFDDSRLWCQILNKAILLFLCHLRPFVTNNNQTFVLKYSSKIKQFTDFLFPSDNKRFLTENLKIRINTNFSSRKYDISIQLRWAAYLKVISLTLKSISNQFQLNRLCRNLNFNIHKYFWSYHLWIGS